jgi:hypothetical protein
MKGLREQERHLYHYADLFVSGLVKYGEEEPVDMVECVRDRREASGRKTNRTNRPRDHVT